MFEVHFNRCVLIDCSQPTYRRAWIFLERNSTEVAFPASQLAAQVFISTLPDILMVALLGLKVFLV